MLSELVYLVAASAALPPAFADCQQALRLVQPGQTLAPGRGVGPRDLVALRDFGSAYSREAAQPPFTVSPDGRFVALILRRADVDRDSYCFGVFVIAIDGGRPARLVDSGGEPMLETSDVRGLAALPIGNVLARTPVWSPDGRWLAYLRRDGNVNRLWRAAADGSRVERVAAVAEDATVTGWAADGAAVIVRSQPGLAEAQARIAREEREGFLFGARFWPLSSARPFPPSGLPAIDRAVAIGGPHAARVVLPQTKSAGDAAAPAGAARSPNGALAWLAAEDPHLFLAPRPLHVRRGGREIVCRSLLCRDDINAFWWGEDGALYFIRAGSASNGGIAIFARWRLEWDVEPVALLATRDLLDSCVGSGNGALCVRETASHPRSLALVAADGSIKTLFDPNPEFSVLATGHIERLTWRLRDGVSSYGDLVLPPGHRPGERHPLVIVQYRSRGFLRGGVGDEYPIHAFATWRFAVLSVERPPPVGAGRARSLDAFMKARTRRFAERRRVHASIEAGVRAAIATGAVDRSRIGITGLSDGAAAVQFGLLHSRLFAAAAISSCCDEPSGAFVADRGYSDLLRKAGYPASGRGQPFWRAMSLAANASRVRTPILMQLTADEFRLGLETFTALDRANAPVEMFVFSDGYHQKWRPAHRLAIYSRGLDWFDFWLNGKADPDPAKAAQYVRWRALLARQPR